MMTDCKPGESGPHIFVIAPADGPTSSGECQNCHWTKDFTNHSLSPLWASPEQIANAKKNAAAERKERARQKREQVL